MVDDVQKKEIYQKIRSCVKTSISRKDEPIPGSSLEFGKPDGNDFNEYNRVVDELNVQ